jgi:predicted nicotinamide N-methyase
MREERIVIAGRELLIARPDDPESLIDEERFEEDEFLPYWAELWPSGVALAAYVATLDLAGRRVLELGCGLALPSFAASLSGADVLATDWASDALSLVGRNAETNGLQVETAVVDWRAPPPTEISGFDVVLAADVLYEERNAVPLLGMLAAATSGQGTVLIADPGRRHATGFFDRARAGGWSLEHVPAQEIPSGGIAILRRVMPAGGNATLS